MTDPTTRPDRLQYNYPLIPGNPEVLTGSLIITAISAGLASLAFFALLFAIFRRKGGLPGFLLTVSCRALSSSQRSRVALADVGAFCPRSSWPDSWLWSPLSSPWSASSPSTGVSTGSTTVLITVP